jgi:hypothetical protein
MREKPTFPGSGEHHALSRFRCDFIIKSRQYQRCLDETTRQIIVTEIDGILDHHTELEVTLGLLAIAEFTR